MNEKTFDEFFRRLSAAVLIPLIGESAFLLREVILMRQTASYGFELYPLVPDVIETILGTLVLYLGVSVMMFSAIRRRKNSGNSKHK